jgi:Glycosyltransferase like family 2
VELARAGKARALNAADPLLEGDVHVYLDADVVLSRGALHALSEALAGQPAPRLASVRPLPLLPADRGARSYAEVWMRLPSVADEVVGLGCYAVNRAGRRRWSSMPEIIADDAFVRARFSPEERVLLGREHFVYAFPSGRDLVGVAARWREGNRELARRQAADDPRSSRRGAVLAVARQPATWRHLPAFAATTRAIRRRASEPKSWPRVRRPQSIQLPLEPRLTVAVVTSDKTPHVEECLRSLRGALTGLEATIVVVDSRSSETLPDNLSELFPAISLIRCDHGADLAATVNRSVATAAGDLVLLVGAEARIGAETIDPLLSVARRFPWAGLYGAQTHVHRRSLARPAAILARRTATAQRLAGAHTLDSPMTATRVRRTMTLYRSPLLLRGDVWSTVGGLTERPPSGDHCEDLCARARQRGFTPLQIETARSGASTLEPFEASR